MANDGVETDEGSMDDPSHGSVHVEIFKSEKTSLAKALLGLSSTDTKAEWVLEPVPIGSLLTAVERSGALRPNIDAYITNIDSRGHHFDPVIDIVAPDALEKVADAMFVEALSRANDADNEIDDVNPPTEEAVKKKFEHIKRRVKVDEVRAKAFFDNCFPDGSFTELRQLTRQDLESVGDAYWEVLRGKDNLIRTLLWERACNIRIGKKPLDEVEVKERVKVTDISFDTIKVKRQFLTYVRLDNTNTVVAWFKSFGDPRVMSKQSGNFFEDVAEMQKKEPKSTEATEIFRFHIHSAVSLYGQPRWIGDLPAVLGSREVDEVNLDYFMSNGVPALALLVSGARFGSGQHERLKEFFEEEVRGRRATHKVVVLEAEPSRRTPDGPSRVPKMEFVPLRNTQISDALFQEYDKRNMSKLSADFRHPESIASASKPTLADMRFAEEQVYQPEREGFDELMNKFIMPAIGLAFVKFQTNSTPIRDPETMGKLAILSVKEGVIVPNEGRKVLRSVFGIEFPMHVERWAKQPLPITLASLGVAAGPAEAVRQQGRNAGDASTQTAELLGDVGLDPLAPPGTPDPDPPPPPPPPPPDPAQKRALPAMGALPAMHKTGEDDDDGDSEE